MRILLDTSVIVRTYSASLSKQIADGAMSNLAAEVGVLYVCSQVLVEFRAVATRPEHVNGLGFSSEVTTHESDLWLDRCVYIEENRDIVAVWMALSRGDGEVRP